MSSSSETSGSDERVKAPLLAMLDLDSVAEEAAPDTRAEVGDHLVTGTNADGSRVDLDALCELAARVLADEGAPAGQLDLHLVDLDTMRELNRAHMESDEPTDVLAFPLDPDELDPFGVGDRPVLLGDVVMCPAVAFGQAAGHAGSFEAEMALLTIHGTLHVLGHDHGETDERLAMQARERHYLEGLDFTHPVPGP